ncbi:hypothetical protein HDV63DRAFT_363275 [Trichoderma sp. SZMC 28014]
MDNQPNLSKDEEVYESSAKNSFKSTYGQNDAEISVIPATSFSSDYKTAEPCLSQQPEYEVLSSGKADGAASSSQRSRAHDLRADNTSQIPLRQRAHDLADDITTSVQRTPYNLHGIDEDIFWTGTQDSRTYQHTPMFRNGGKGASKFSLETAKPENMDSEDAGGATPGKTISKTPTVSQHAPLFREKSSTAGCQHESKYEQIEDTEANKQQEFLRKMRGSPTRAAAASSPKTPGRGVEAVKATVESEDSPKRLGVTNPTKSFKQTIESSDVSTWKQQLRKVGDSRSKPPKKPHSPLTAGSQLHSSQSPTAFLQNEETTTRSTREYEAESNEQASRARKQRESINDSMESLLAENDNAAPKMILTAPHDDSELSSGHHVCEWRSRYLGLSAAFDKLQSELDVALQQQANTGTGGQEPETASHHNRYNGYDIEGLTIIVHRRSMEDLVLNTDLREDEFSDIGE